MLSCCELVITICVLEPDVALTYFCKI